MLTDKELTVLLKQVEAHLDPKWLRLEELERKVEDLCNDREASKPKTGGSKRVQQTQEDA